MTVSAKFFRVALIAAALIVPLFIMNLLVWDRNSTAAEVRAQITDGWARSQTLRGPYLVVPFEEALQTTSNKGLSNQVMVQRTDAVVLAPDDLTVNARLRPQKRERSLFEVIVYQSEVAIDARFSPRSLALADVDPSLLDWERAYFVVGITDPRGFGAAIPRFNIDGRAIEAEPGSRSVAMPGGALSAPAGLAAAPTGPLDFTARLALKGSTDFAILGTARRLVVNLASPWPHPSFVGGLLPDSREISDQGFTARWSTTHLALNKPLAVRASMPGAMARDGSAAAGVALIEPVDLYAHVERAVKYGALIIALTFLAYFVFDVTSQRRIPMLAYALVGLGLVLFFLLLLALAEYVSLAPAYVIAAAALVGLISAYSKAVLASARRAVVIAGVLTLLYLGLYVLLQLEEFALLLGSISLFAALAVLMYVTRDVQGENAALEGRSVSA